MSDLNPKQVTVASYSSPVDDTICNLTTGVREAPDPVELRRAADGKNIPNFFIVGFGRSGSTSLYKYLREHPEIFMSPVKEPKFFSWDLAEGEKCRIVARPEEYLGLFDDAGNQKVRGEASTMYILSDVAAQAIHDFSPDARILILLRNPVDFLHSWHSLGVRDGYEDEPDFSRALELEPERTESNLLHPGAAAVSYRYRHVVTNAPADVRRFLDKFGPEQVMFVRFDDLSQRTEAIYREILEFLRVDPGFRPDFKVHNSTRTFSTSKNRWLGRTLQKYGETLSRLRRMISDKPLGVRAALQKANTKKVERQPMDPVLRRELTVEFTPVVQELEQLSGCDLSVWYS